MRVQTFLTTFFTVEKICVEFAKTSSPFLSLTFRIAMVTLFQKIDDNIYREKLEKSISAIEVYALCVFVLILLSANLQNLKI